MEEMDEEIRRLDEEEEEECIFTMSYADRMVLSVLQRRYKPPTPADWRYRTDFEAKIARQKSGGPDQPHKETLFDKLYAAYLAELEFSKDQQQDVDDEDEDDDWEMQEEDEGVEEVSELRSKQYKAADDGGTMNSEFHNTEVTSNPTDKVIITQTMRPKSAMKPSGKQRSLNPSVSIKSTGRVSTMSDRSGSLKSQVSPKRGASLSASRSKEASLVSMRSSRSMRANFSAAAPLSPVQGLQGISTIDTADDLPANSNQSPPALTASTQTNNEAHQTTSNAQPTSMKRGVSVRQVQEISRKDLFGKYLAGNRKAAEGRSFQQSAVSMQFLNDFVYRLHQASVNSASLTNEQVLIAHILPQSAQRGLSYVDSGLVLPEDVSTPTYVVLQRWGGRFIEMVDALRHFSAGVPPDKIFFWIDMFAVNYHAKPGGLGDRPATTIRNLAKSGPNTATTVGGSQRNMVLITEDRHWLTPTRMDSILETSTSGLIVIMDEKAPIAWPLNQPWPLYLIYRTLADKGWPAVQLLARSRGCTLSSVHRNTKINLMEAMVDAQASGAAAVAAVAAALSVDPAADVLPPRTAAPPVLLRHIKENVDGGVPGLEEMLQLAIWLDPQGDFRSEVRQLLRSCNSSVMADGLIEIEPETEPLKPGLDPPRWMNLEKYNQWLKLSQYELSYKCFGICGPAGSGKSVISAALIASSEDHSHLSAWYICQSSQQRRSSPLGLLCTLAYQLALKYPPLMSFLTESLAVYAPLHHLADKISLALRLLLRAPLLELAEQGLVPEEGIVILLDGLEEVGSRGDGADSQHMIMLREELHKLPAFCRFIITSSPAAEKLLVWGLLPFKVYPWDLQRHDVIESSIKKPLLEIIERGAENEEQGLRMQGQLQKGLQKLMDGCHTPLLACIILARMLEWMLAGRLAEVAHARAIMHSRKSPQQGPSSAGGASSKRGAAIILQELGEDPVSDILSELPDNVPGAIRALFMSHIGSLGPKDLIKVTKLLQILVAARDPLPISLFKGELVESLTTLPGWGFLFYQSGLEVHVAHRAVSDWLRQSGKQETNSKDTAGPASGEKADGAVVKGAVTGSGGGSGLTLLSGSMEWKMNVTEGHVLLNKLITEDPASREGHPRDYSLRHALTHACMAKDGPAARRLALKSRQWQFMFEEGTARAAVRALQSISQILGEDMTRELGTWVRQYGPYLNRHPKAVISWALAGPRCSPLATTDGVGQIPAHKLNRDKAWPSWQSCLDSYGHKEAILCMTSLPASPNNLNIPWLVTGSKDGSVRVWNAATGERAAILSGHTEQVCGVAFSPDGAILASLGRDNVMCLWDARKWQQVDAIALKLPLVTAVGTKQGVTPTLLSPSTGLFSPSKTPLVGNSSLGVGGAVDVNMSGAGGGGVVGMKTSSSKIGPCMNLIMTMNGRFAATLHVNDVICTWEVATGNRLAVKRGMNPSTFSPAGILIASAVGEHEVHVWEATTKRHRAVLHCGSHPSALALSYCEGTAAAGLQSGDVLVFDVLAGGVQTTMLQGNTSPLTTLAFSRNSKHLASAGVDRMVMLWEVQTGRRLITAFEGVTATITSISWLTDGKHVAVGAEDGSLLLYDGATAIGIGCNRRMRGAEEGSAARSAKALCLIPGTESAANWLQAPSRVRTAMLGPAPKPGSRGMHMMVLVDMDNSAQVWDCISGCPLSSLEKSNLSTGQYQISLPTKTALLGLAVAPIMPQPPLSLLDGSEHFMIWDIENGEFVARQVEGCNPVISPNGRVIAVTVPSSDPPCIKILEASHPESVVLELPSCSSISFSPDSTYMAIQVWRPSYSRAGTTEPGARSTSPHKQAGGKQQNSRGFVDGAEAKNEVTGDQAAWRNASSPSRGRQAALSQDPMVTGRPCALGLSSPSGRHGTLGLSSPSGSAYAGGIIPPMSPSRTAAGTSPGRGCPAAAPFSPAASVSLLPHPELILLETASIFAPAAGAGKKKVRMTTVQGAPPLEWSPDPDGQLLAVCNGVSLAGRGSRMGSRASSRSGGGSTPGGRGGGRIPETLVYDMETLFPPTKRQSSVNEDPEVRYLVGSFQDLPFVMAASTSSGSLPSLTAPPRVPSSGNFFNSAGTRCVTYEGLELHNRTLSLWDLSGGVRMLSIPLPPSTSHAATIQAAVNSSPQESQAGVSGSHQQVASRVPVEYLPKRLQLSYVANFAPAGSSLLVLPAPAPSSSLAMNGSLLVSTQHQASTIPSGSSVFTNHKVPLAPWQEAPANVTEPGADAVPEALLINAREGKLLGSYPFRMLPGCATLSPDGCLLAVARIPLEEEEEDSSGDESERAAAAPARGAILEGAASLVLDATSLITVATAAPQKIQDPAGGEEAGDLKAQRSDISLGIDLDPSQSSLDLPHAEPLPSLHYFRAVKLVDTGSGKVLHVLRAPSGVTGIRKLCFSQHSLCVSAISDCGRLLVWSCQSGRLLKTWPGYGIQCSNAGWTGNRFWAVSGDGEEVLVTDAIASTMAAAEAANAAAATGTSSVASTPPLSPVPPAAPSLQIPVSTVLYSPTHVRDVVARGAILIACGTSKPVPTNRTPTGPPPLGGMPLMTRSNEALNGNPAAFLGSSSATTSCRDNVQLWRLTLGEQAVAASLTSSTSSSAVTLIPGSTSS